MNTLPARPSRCSRPRRPSRGTWRCCVGGERIKKGEEDLRREAERSVRAFSLSLSLLSLPTPHTTHRASSGRSRNRMPGGGKARRRAQACEVPPYEKKRAGGADVSGNPGCHGGFSAYGVLVGGAVVHGAEGVRVGERRGVSRGVRGFGRASVVCCSSLFTQSSVHTESQFFQPAKNPAPKTTPPHPPCLAPLPPALAWGAAPLPRPTACTRFPSSTAPTRRRGTSCSCRHPRWTGWVSVVVCVCKRLGRGVLWAVAPPCVFQCGGATCFRRAGHATPARRVVFPRLARAQGWPCPRGYWDAAPEALRAAGAAQKHASAVLVFARPAPALPRPPPKPSATHSNTHVSPPHLRHVSLPARRIPHALQSRKPRGLPPHALRRAGVCGGRGRGLHAVLGKLCVCV